MSDPVPSVVLRTTNVSKALLYAVFVVCTMFLFIVCWDVIDSPPAFDQTGLITEADFLARHQLDYAALLRETPTDEGGGARAYVTILPPTFIAMANIVLGSPHASFVFYRCVNFIAAGLIASSFFLLLATRTSHWFALAATIAMMLTPLFNTQVEMLGLENLQILFIVWTTLAIQRDRWILAATCALGAFLMKNSGLIVIFCVGATLFVKTLLEWNEQSRRTSLRRLAGVLACAMLTVGELLFAFFGGAIHGRIAQPHLFDKWVAIRSCLPDLMILLALGMALISVAMLCRFVGLVRSGGSTFHSCRDTIKGVLAWEGVFSLLMMGSGAVIVSQVVFHPRYSLLLFPSMYLLVALGVAQVLRVRPASTMLFCLLAAMNGANFNGRLFPALPEPFAGVGTFLERSHEYRRYHFAMIRMVRRLLEESEATPLILSEYPARILSNPGLGFVDQPRRAYVTIPDVQSPVTFPIRQLLSDKPSEVVVVLFHEPFRLDYQFALPLPDDSIDEVIYQDDLPFPNIAYRKRFDDSTSASPHRDFYLKLLTNPADAFSLMQELQQAEHRESDDLDVPRQIGRPANPSNP